jgi:molybdopterin-synthase adenylyltransferase
MGDGRFDRQVRLFGTNGQALIEGTCVGVVGAGGLGSHLLQQLAYLGTQRFVIVDGDVVNVSNLNRLVGATSADVGAAKVAVARRLINGASPAADVRMAKTTFVSDDALSLLRECSVIFGCVDSDAVRLALNDFCQSHALPYFDLATDIHASDPSGLTFGGRVVFVADGELCLVCAGVLSQDAVRVGLLSRAERETHEAIYGVPAPELDGAGPAVVSLNGVIASLAVTEFLVQTTGLRPARRHLEYRGMRGIVTVSTDPPQEHCHYCTHVYRSGSFDAGAYTALADAQ